MPLRAKFDIFTRGGNNHEDLILFKLFPRRNLIKLNRQWEVRGLEMQMDIQRRRIVTMKKLIRQMQQLDRLRDQVKRATFAARRRRGTGGQAVGPSARV